MKLAQFDDVTDFSEFEDIDFDLRGDAERAEQGEVASGISYNCHGDGNRNASMRHVEERLYVEYIAVRIVLVQCFHAFGNGKHRGSFEIVGWSADLHEIVHEAHYFILGFRCHHVSCAAVFEAGLPNYQGKRTVLH